LGQTQERKPTVDENLDPLQANAQGGETDAGARDAAGNAAIARVLADLGPNPSMADLVAEMKKQAPAFPDPKEGSAKDPASAEAGHVRELLMRLTTDSADLPHDLAMLRNASHNVSTHGSTYASAAAAVCALAIQALDLLQKPTDADAPIL
jgi:hypothetical protein